MSKFYDDLAMLKFYMRNAQMWLDKASMQLIDLEDSHIDQKKHLIDALNDNEYDLRKYLPLGKNNEY